MDADFVQMGVGFDNAGHFEQKVDYLASRYAVLKERIQTQYTGDKQESEIQSCNNFTAQQKKKWQTLMQRV